MRNKGTSFSPAQEEAIQKKIDLLRQVAEGRMSPDELSESLIRARLDWLNQNRHLLRTDVPLPEAAFRLLAQGYMKIADPLVIVSTAKSLTVESRDFCPYLEACIHLKLDTRLVCRSIGEPSLVAFYQAIDPRLHFWREYDRLRPNSEACVEHLELLD